MNNIKAKSLVAGLVTVTLVSSSWCGVTPLAKEEPIIIVQDKLEEEVKQTPAMITISIENNLVAEEETEEITECVEETYECEEYEVDDNLSATYEEAEAKRTYENVFANSKATYNVPSGGGAKPWNITYMSYTAVTKKSSPQYRILNSDICYTDEETGIRMVNGMYCIAIGTGFHAPVGTVVALVTEEDVIPCVVSDIKADCHTDATHTYCTVDGSVVEFVIDKSVFTGSEMYPDELEHNVKQIAVYDMII